MLEERELRSVYADEMIRLAEADERIVTIDADLMKAIGMTKFKERFPDRAFDVGVAEANMVGIAAGMSAMGKIPVVHSFSPFATRRTFDQITISVAYAKLNVKIIGSDPGITAEVNGGTHMGLDDISLMRGIPNMTVVEPVDEVSLKGLLPLVIGLETPVYVRLPRKKQNRVYEAGATFELGKANILRDGEDCAIISGGIMVYEALEAARALEKDGIQARVIDMHTIKPLDKETILKTARECKAVVTAENHTIMGGLGSAVAEVIAENGIGVPFRRIGINDRFGEVGFKAYLQETMGLTAENIEKTVRDLMKK